MPLYKSTTYYEKEYTNPIEEYIPTSSNFSIELNLFDDLEIELDFTNSEDIEGLTELDLLIPDYINLCVG